VDSAAVQRRAAGLAVVNGSAAPARMALGQPPVNARSSEPGDSLQCQLGGTQPDVCAGTVDQGFRRSGVARAGLISGSPAPPTDRILGCGGWFLDLRHSRLSLLPPRKRTADPGGTTPGNGGGHDCSAECAPPGVGGVHPASDNLPIADRRRVASWNAARIHRATIVGFFCRSAISTSPPDGAVPETPRK